ncbi:hypothetical protein RSJ42_04460 [Methanosarcina hadiensis]|uniref:hypothetical protein n=1 Tax=Methanosarcina hadiensis TaxID=3078083 RepID=UPI003977299D
MDDIEKKLEDFFRKYEARFNKSLVGTIDIEETANSFTDCFIEANPFGVHCGKNDDQFRAVIIQGYDFYKSIGTKSLIIDSVKVSSLDEYHSIAKVHWRSFYNKKDGREELIEFDVIYFVQMIDEKPKIFAYITGDEQKMLREKGLIS